MEDKYEIIRTKNGDLIDVLATNSNYFVFYSFIEGYMTIITSIFRLEIQNRKL